MAETAVTAEPAPPSMVIVSTEKFFIRPYLATDAEGMAAGANDPDVVHYMRNRFPFPYTLDDAHAWIKLSLDANPVLNFGIFTPEGAFAGGIGLVPFSDVEYRTWEIGYWIARQYWGRGIATAALKEFSRWAFGAFSVLQRIEASVFSGNDASSKVLERAGYTWEGVRRQAAEKKGVVYDSILYSLLRSEVEG